MKRNFYLLNFIAFNSVAKQPSNKFLFRLILGITCLLSVNSSYAQSGQALSFDGVDDYIQLPATITSGSYTKEAWINTNTLSGFPNILSGTGTAVFLNAGRLATGHAGGGFGQLVDTTTSNPITINTWFHVAVTYDSVANELKLYKDGVLVADSIDAITLPYTETTMTIGAFAGGNFWSGEIDEVSIWNVALSASQIAGNMNCGLTGDEPNLVAYYSFNEGIAAGANTINTLLDSSDKCTHYDGTLQNFALTGSASNWVSPGPSLAGGCTNIYPNINVTGNGNCITSGDSIPSSIDSTDFGDFGTTPITKTFTVQNTGGADLTISNVTITGADAADFSVSTSPSTTIGAVGSSNLQITFSPTDAVGVKSAIITINNNDGDEGTFTFSIQGNNAGPGKALAFNGINNFVTLQNITLSGSYTKEAWINTGLLSGFPNILSGTGTALFLNNGQLAAGHAPAFNQLLDTTTTNPIVINTWYHVAVTYDSTANEMKLYRDGVLVADTVGIVSLSYTEPSLSIGTFLGGNYWFGKIDEVRIWDVARTQAQIAGSMNCALTGDEFGLIAYYNFTNGIAGSNNAGDTVLPDLSHKCQVYNGVLSNFDLTGTTSNWVTDTLAPMTCSGIYPNINLTGNAVCIADGDTTISASDNTDFGIATLTPIIQTFIIQNNGLSVLNIDSAKITGADSLDFIITSAPAATVMPGASTSITITFIPLAVGVKTASVNIFNDDSDEASFKFNIQGTGTIVLPVSLQSFNGHIYGTSVKLTWVTSAELNNKGFEILRSPDGVSNWVNIGYVSATSSASAGIYNFTDASPLQGVNTYRLKQLDINGSSKLSQVIALDLGTKGDDISLYPNPVKNKITLTFNDDKLLNTPVRLVTVTGSIVSTINLTKSNQEIDLSAVAPGVYLLTFSNGAVRKVIKQ
jgi:hypothetical protein